MLQNINNFFTNLFDVLKKHIILFFYSPLFLFSVYYIFFFFEQQKKLNLEHLKQQELFLTILREKDLLLSQKDKIISAHLIRSESVVSSVNSDPNILKYYALTVTIVVIVGAIAFIYFKNNPGPSEPKPSYFLDEIQPTLSAGITQVANVSSKNLKPIFTKLTKELTDDLSTQLTCSLESMEKAALANNNAFVHKCEGAVKDIYNNTGKAIESATNLKNREVIIQVDSQSIAKAVSEDLKAELNRMNLNHSNLINTDIAKNDNEIFTKVSDLKEKVKYLANQYPDSKNSFDELIHLCSSIMNQF